MTEELKTPGLSRRRFLATLSGGASVLLLAACSPAAAPSSTVAPAKPAAEPAKPGADAAKPAAAVPAAKPAAGPDPAVIEGAKKEGALQFGDASLQQFNDKPFADAFRKKYGLPDSFQVNHVLLGTGDLITKVQQEVQAGNVTFDLVWVGDLGLFRALASANALLEYTPSELSALDTMVKKLGFPHGPPYWYTIVSYGFTPVWSKKFVKKDIKSWNDIIDPAFKDKTIMSDIRTSSTGTDSYNALKKALPADFFQKYADVTNPTLIFRTAEMQQKLTSGERILAPMHITGRAYQAIQEDKSLDFGAVFPPEGVVPLPIPAGVLAKAPHPNAAKLFLDFLISQEGQQLWVDRECQWSLRTDVTFSPEVKRFLTPLEDVNTLKVDWEKDITPALRDAARAEFRQIFKVS